MIWIESESYWKSSDILTKWWKKSNFLMNFHFCWNFWFGAVQKNATLVDLEKSSKNAAKWVFGCKNRCWYSRERASERVPCRARGLAVPLRELEVLLERGAALPARLEPLDFLLERGDELPDADLANPIHHPGCVPVCITLSPKLVLGCINTDFCN